jgi:hypothetical protein
MKVAFSSNETVSKYWRGAGSEAPGGGSDYVNRYYLAKSAELNGIDR